MTRERRITPAAPRPKEPNKGDGEQDNKGTNLVGASLVGTVGWGWGAATVGASGRGPWAGARAATRVCPYGKTLRALVVSMEQGERLNGALGYNGWAIRFHGSRIGDPA